MTATPDSIRSRLQAHRGRYPAIATRFGFSYSTLSKFANGERGLRPSFEFVDQLTKALDTLEQEQAEAAPKTEPAHA